MTPEAEMKQLPQSIRSDLERRAVAEFKAVALRAIALADHPLDQGAILMVGLAAVTGFAAGCLRHHDKSWSGEEIVSILLTLAQDAMTGVGPQRTTESPQ